MILLLHRCIAHQVATQDENVHVHEPVQRLRAQERMLSMQEGSKKCRREPPLIRRFLQESQQRVLRARRRVAKGRRGVLISAQSDTYHRFRVRLVLPKVVV